jgi:hypothetical protein
VFVLYLAGPAVLIVCLTHLSVWVGSRETEDEKEQDRRRYQKKRQRDDKSRQPHTDAISSRLEAVADEFDSYRKQQRHHDRKNTLLEVSGVTAAFAAAAFALWSVWVFQGQLGALQRQVRDAEIQEAASISIRNLAVSGFPDKTVVSFDGVNTGRTRAEQFSADVISMWVPPQGVFETVTKSVGTGPVVPSQFGITVDPSDPPRHMTRSVDVAPTIPNLPPDMLKHMPTRERLISGEVVSIISVVGIYKDVFGRVQHVVDCVIYNPGTGFGTCRGQSNRHY